MNFSQEVNGQEVKTGPAEAGTTKRALAYVTSGVVRGFQSGLKPELRTQKSCGFVIREIGKT